MYLLTHSLLSAWAWVFEDGDRDGMSELVAALKREKGPETDAMIKGREFEAAVCACVATPEGFQPPITTIADMVRGCRQQVRISTEAAIDGTPYLLYGVADFIGHGDIYDTKYTGHYEVGKYRGSTQHPMYLRILPEAQKFVYIVSNGRAMWTEEYRREDVPPIDITIRQFGAWIASRPELHALYKAHWEAR